MNKDRQSGEVGRQRLIRSFILGLFTAFLGLQVLASTPGAKSERELGLDWLFKNRGFRPPPQDVSVVSINGRTGPALKLPDSPNQWPRTKHADLIRALTERDVDGIVFDIDFKDAKPEDAEFAKAIATADRVILFTWLSQGRGASYASDRRRSATEILARAAKALGPFPVPKRDQAVFQFWAFKGGVPTTAAIALQLKALPLYEQWLSVLKEAQAPNLGSLPVNARGLKAPEDMQQLMEEFREMFRDPRLVRRVAQALLQVPDKDRQLLTALASLYAGPEDYHLNFYGPPGTIKTVSYQSLLGAGKGEATQEKVDLKNDVVFVGFSELSSTSQHGFYTSFTDSNGVDLSGVEIMATAYANLLNQEFIRPSANAALTVSFFGLICGVLVYLLPAPAGIALAILFTGLYVGFVRWQFDEMNLWLPLATPAIQLVSAIFIGLSAQSWLRRREKEHAQQKEQHARQKEQHIRQTFELYHGREVAKVLEGEVSEEERDITMLMADLRGFTSLSERLPPKKSLALINRYLSAMDSVIEAYQGTINEIIGDAIFVLFGAPTLREDDAQRAVTCAVAMQLAMASVNEQNRQDGWPEIEMGIGIHTGRVMVGNIGSMRQKKYGVSGSEVNLTSRIQSATVGGQIFISEATRRDAEPILRLGQQIYIKAKGVEQSLSLHEVLGIAGKRDLFLPETNDKLVPLKREITIEYEVVEDSRHSGQVHKGTLVNVGVRDSSTRRFVSAVVRLEHPVPQLSNIGLKLMTLDGKEIIGTPYAKVMGSAPEDARCFLISFTSLPVDAEAFLRDLTERLARVD